MAGLLRALRAFRESRKTPARLLAETRRLLDLMLLQKNRQAMAEHPNPLNRFGRKCFSQADEDGITMEILSRIGALRNGAYLEFGVGNGTENNTLIPASLGWKGAWVGGEPLAFRSEPNGKFLFMQQWITLENILELAARGMKHLDVPGIDVLSLDLDGNDIYFAERLLSSTLRPKLYIVEYNAKFPPPVEFQVAYDAAAVWHGDDYFGASLSSFDKLFSRFDYRLVCCNSHTGCNAFFVDAAYSDKFQDVPTEIGSLYSEPNYRSYNNFSHPVSTRTIERILGQA
jgi:hypothetical protein